MKTQQKINCKQANQISILRVALDEGFTPTKFQGDNAWIKLRNEKTASCKINTAKNIFYDFGTGEGGTTIDFAITLKNTDVKGALEYLSQFNSDVFSFETQNQRIDMILEELGHKNKTAFNHYVNNTDNQPIYTIKKIQPLKNSALIDYLRQRKISIEIVSEYVKEIYYTLNDKNYFALAFFNNKGGYEIRNPYFKGCLGKKAITLIQNNNTNLIVFEGFIDFLSWLSHLQIKNIKSDILILNSVALIEKNKTVFKQYHTIDCYLDNDTTGQNSFEKIKLINPYSYNQSSLFGKHKDYNEWLCNTQSS